MRKEVINKLLLVLITFAIIASLISFGQFVSAQEDIQQTAQDIETGVKDTGTIISALLSPLFGEREMVTRIAFAILIFMLVYSVMSLILPPKGWIPGIASGAVTVLTMIAMPSGMLEAIRTQYGAMGGALLTIIPIIILFVFTARIKSLMVAKLMWITFFLYYLALLGYGMFTEEISNRGWYIAATLITVIGFLTSGILRKQLFNLTLETYTEEGESIIKSAKELHKLQKSELESSYGGK